MNAIIEFCQPIMSPLVLVFTILNLLTMGLQVNIPKVAKKISNPKFLLLVFLWGWVVGPLLGLLITKIIPMAEPFSQVILLASLAPCAPFLPPMVAKARGDVSFAGAFIPLAAVGTVIFMPLVAPLMIKGLAISTMSLAKPLIITVFIPLVIGALMKTYAEKFVDRIFKPVKLLANLSTILTIIFCFLLYGKAMANTAGSFALLSMTIFMFVMAFITYRFGFGLQETEKSIMSLGMGTRNIAAVFAGVLAIPNGDPRLMAMTIMYTLWSFILAMLVSSYYGKKLSRLIPTV
jgi:bile acid:Na+ symporter, BASS family